MTRTHIAAIALAALIVTPAAVALADNGKAEGHPATQTLAIIGDIPYGAPLIAEFPADIAQINADPEISRVIHLGDIKNGSSRCDDSTFEARLADFQTFADPLVYTPGDNEWTDCHRVNNGGYLPTERLARIRALFFPQPGETLGGKAEVTKQSRTYPENVLWRTAGAQFGVVHVVGSNDDQFPWFTDRRDGSGTLVPETPVEAALQAREFLPREAASLEWIDRIFDEAEQHHAPGVVLGMQADMWDGAPSDQTAFIAIKAVIADRAAHFGKPVLLMQGDSHVFKVDRPAGQPANLTRLVVEGSTTVPHEWLRLHVDPSRTGVFSCENVVFVSGVVTPCPGPLAP